MKRLGILQATYWLLGVRVDLPGPCGISSSCGGLLVLFQTLPGWHRLWKVLCGPVLAGLVAVSAATVLSDGPAAVRQPEIVQHEIVKLCERAWFERAYAVAETDTIRRQVAGLAAAVGEDALRRSAWLDDVDHLMVSWSRAADGVPPEQMSGRFAWTDQSGFHVVKQQGGRPVWGGGLSARQPLFPRNQGLEGSALVRDTTTGSLVTGAGRLLGLVSLPMDRQVSCQIVALDLAPAVEGRLIWSQQLTSAVSLADAGLAADASLCVVVYGAVEPNVRVRAMAASDGRTLWQQTVSRRESIAEARRPSVVICQQFVVLMLSTGQLIAFDRSNGCPAWQQDDLRDLLSSSSGMLFDAIVVCTDRLIVLLRSAVGLPELVHIAIADGRLIGRSRLVLAQGASVKTIAGDASTDIRRDDISEMALLGPPTVLAGRAVWPVGQITRSPPKFLLSSKVTPESTPFTNPDVPLVVVARMVEIQDQSVGGVPPLTGLSGQRLGVLSGGRFWCLSPPVETQGAEERPGH